MISAVQKTSFSATRAASHGSVSSPVFSRGGSTVRCVSFQRCKSAGAACYIGRRSRASLFSGSARLGLINRFRSFSSQGLQSHILPADWPLPIPAHFGLGRIHDLPSILKNDLKVNRPLLVCDGNLVNTPVIAQIREILGSGGIDVSVFSHVVANPTDVNIEDGRRAFLEHRADALIAVGGGSGLDAGKSIAMVSPIAADSDVKDTTGTPTNSFTLDELEWTKEQPALDEGTRLPPVITIPTTAGTGAEMDSASMYTDTKKNVKFCVRHTQLPLQTLLDPMLTVSLPKRLTAWTGMDALTHAIEAFLSNIPEGAYGAPIHDAVGLEAIRLINLHLLDAVAQPDNLVARSGMLVASSLAAVSFGIKGLGAVHGLSEPIGAVCDTQHGLTNAILLPYFLRFNYQLVASEENCKETGSTLQQLNAKCERIVDCLGLRRSGNLDRSAFDMTLDWIVELRRKLEIPNSLTDIGVKASSCQELALKASQNATGFTNFPRPLTVDEYAQVFREACNGNA